MPWLNWSLKFHIRLRSISLLIFINNTQVYVQWIPYSFMWLYLIKCVFICSIFVDSNTKRFFSVLGVFGKYFVFTKTKNFKNSVALFWRLSRGSSKSHATVASLRLNFATWVTRDWVAKTGQKWFLKFSDFKNKILFKNT